MEETKRTYADDEGEETMVAPRFDDEETVLARPVVPFEEVGDAPPVAHAAETSRASTTVAPPPYSQVRGKPRRSLVAALVLVSALVGSVLGVAGLYFYQNRKSADAPAAEQQQQQQAEAPAAQPTAEAVAETTGGATSAPASAAPAASASAVPEAEADEDDDADAAKDKDSDESDAGPVAERRGGSVSEDREPAVTPKRGKKGARDEEIQRGARRAPRYDDEDDRPVARDDDSGDDRREARRVGVITYRPRRVRPRRDRYDSPDRLRRIFEGQP